MTAKSQASETAVSGGAVAASGTAIVACGACCALPTIFPALALGASGAVLAWLADAHGWLSLVAALVVVSGWGWAVLKRRSGGRPRTSTWVMLTIATALTAVALVWPWIEPMVLRSLSA